MKKSSTENRGPFSHNLNFKEIKFYSDNSLIDVGKYSFKSTSLVEFEIGPNLVTISGTTFEHVSTFKRYVMRSGTSNSNFFVHNYHLALFFEVMYSIPCTAEIIEKLKHGVTEIRVRGAYTGDNKFMLVCIIRKKQIGEMMKIIKKYPKTFASFSRVNEVFGRFKP